MGTLGLLMRVLYMAGDLVLYRWVFRYQFTASKWKLALGVFCGGLFLALPVFKFFWIFQWWFCLLFMLIGVTSVLLFQRLQVGLVFFVYIVRQITSNFLKGFLQLNGLSELENLIRYSWYMIGANIGILFVILLIGWIFRDNGTLKYVQSIKSYFFWLSGMLLLVPATSIFWGSPSVENIRRAEAIGMIKDGLLGFAMAGWVVFSLALREKKQRLEEQSALNIRCIREQTEQYRLLNEKQKELRSFRHDINGHFTALQRMVEQENIIALKKYIRDLKVIHEDTCFISSDHIIGDAIFNEYYSKGKEEDVLFDVMGKFDKNLTMSETDLCVVLSNVISNAYEAAVRCKEMRQVLVEIGQGKNFTFLKVTNTVKERPDIVDGIMQTTKEDKNLHGFGITNIINVLRKYEGTIEWKYEDGKVITEIVI